MSDRIELHGNIDRQSNANYEYVKQWRIRNPEKVKAQHRRYWQNMSEIQRKKQRAAHKKWRLGNGKEKVRRYQREYEVKNKTLNRARKLRRRYGMSIEDYHALHNKQGGACAICGITGMRLDVDHCHSTKVVRGLLCNGCNRMLGFARDDRNTLLAASEYLIRSRT